MSEHAYRFSREMEDQLAAYLERVGRHLKGTPSERAEILAELDSQVRVALLDRGGEQANSNDLDDILLSMDPPEAYGESASDRELPPQPRPGRRWHWVGLGLAGVILLLIVIYYFVVDVILFSEGRVHADTGSNVESVTVPSAVAPVSGDLAEEEPVDVAQGERTTIPVAVADFSTSANIRDADVVRTAIRDGLINVFAFEPSLAVVERELLDHAIRELRLGAEGMLTQSTAAQLGRLTGARVIVSGTIIRIDENLVITARLINAETGELSATRVTGAAGDLLSLADDLAEQIIDRVDAEKDGTLARAEDAEAVRTRQERRRLKELAAGRPLPRLLVVLPESHLARVVPDPAGETELIAWLTYCGFPVASPEYEGIKAPGSVQEWTGDTDIAFRRNRGWRNEAGEISISQQTLSHFSQKGLGEDRAKLSKVADLMILGEGFSERASERAGLISCKARLELKVVDIRSGRILLAKSTYGAGVDVAEHVAGKRALQAAGRAMGLDLIPELVEAGSRM